MTDERLEQIVGNLLRIGVGASAAVAGVGGLWYLLAHGFAAPGYHRFAPRVFGLPSFHVLSPPERIIFAGLLMLIATPVARVAFTLAAFALRGDRTYAVITLIVLLALIYSIGTSWL